MKRVLVALALAGTMTGVVVTNVSAAPINCPGSQVAVHDDSDQWSCVNKAGHGNESDQEKNDHHPN
jgi:hypothetical protein